MKKAIATIAAIGLAVCAGQSRADLLADWGMSGQVYVDGSYGQWNNDTLRTEQGVTGGVTWAEGNDTVPDNSSFGPAPSGGEQFDIEFLGWRVVNGQFQVLGITSVNPDSGSVGPSGNTFHMGDIFINTGGGAGDSNGVGYDYAITVGNWSTTHTDSLHLADGAYVHNYGFGLYGIDDVDDVHGVAQSPVGFGGTSGNIDELSNPLALRGAQTELASAGRTVETLPNDNGAGNWIIQYAIDLAAFEALLPIVDGQRSYAGLSLHWTVECANDFIGVDEPGPNEPTVPEPATLTLLGLGLATMGMARRKRAA